MEKWNFKINGRDKILELESKTDGSRMRIKMVDTKRGHYTIVLETKRSPDCMQTYASAVSDVPVLSLEDKEGDLCSFKAVRKVHKIN